MFVSKRGGAQKAVRVRLLASLYSPLAVIIWRSMVAIIEWFSR